MVVFGNGDLLICWPFSGIFFKTILPNLFNRQKMSLEAYLHYLLASVSFRKKLVFTPVKVFWNFNRFLETFWLLENYCANSEVKCSIAIPDFGNFLFFTGHDLLSAVGMSIFDRFDRLICFSNDKIFCISNQLFSSFFVTTVSLWPLFFLWHVLFSVKLACVVVLSVTQLVFLIAYSTLSIVFLDMFPSNWKSWKDNLIKFL